MHGAKVFLLGLVAGAAGGAGLAALLATGRAPGGSHASPDTAAAPPSASGPVLQTLERGTGNPSTHPQGRAGAAADGVATEFERWYVEAARRLPDPGRVLRPFWLGLVSAYAAAGRIDDLERACDGALEAGVPARDLLLTLKQAGRSPSLQRLIARHPDAGWDLRTRLDSGDSKDPAPLLHALRAVREQLVAARQSGALPSPPEVGVEELLRRLAAIDPGKAAWEADALASGTEEPWLLCEVAQGLRAQPSAAVPFLKRALAQAPLYRQAMQVLMDVDLAAATSHLEALVARDPSLAVGWSFLSDARARADDQAGAVAALVRAADLDPSHERLDTLASLDPAAALPLLARATQGPAAGDAQVWALRARTEMCCGSAATGLDAWLRALQLDPAEACDSDYDAWIALDPRRAADVLAPLSERAFAAGDDDLLVAYATALVAAKDAKAFAVCRKAVEQGIWWQGLPALLARADPARALPLLEERRGKGGADVELQRALGEAYLGLGRRAEAATAFESALAFTKERGWWFPDLWVGLVRSDPVGGLQRVQTLAAEIGPGVGPALMGDALAALGRTAEAKASYDRALEADPQNVAWRARRAALR